MACRWDNDDRDSDRRYHEAFMALAERYDERSSGVAQGTSDWAADGSAPSLTVTTACRPMLTAGGVLLVDRRVADASAAPPTGAPDSGHPVAVDGFGSAPPLIVTRARGPVCSPAVSVPAGPWVAGGSVTPPAGTLDSGLPIPVEGVEGSDGDGAGPTHPSGVG